MSDKLIDPVEKLARKLAYDICGGGDPDIVVVPSWPRPAELACGFVVVPQHGRPLWQWFEPAAREALALKLSEQTG